MCFWIKTCLLYTLNPRLRRKYIHYEIGELVGLYLLNRLSNVIVKNGLSLYRNDELAAITNEKIRKDIFTLFKDEELPITIKSKFCWIRFFRCYLQTCDLLKLSFTNSNTQIFEEPGTEKLFDFSQMCQNEKTNIAKLFVKLVTEHFPKNNKYSQIFNLNTWSWVIFVPPKLETSSNNIILKCWVKKNDKNKPKCNCRSKPNCPLNGEFLLSIYYKNIHLQHLITVLFTMEVLKGRSRYDKTTIQNRLNTVNAWLIRLSYQNMCGT